MNPKIVLKRKFRRRISEEEAEFRKLAVLCGIHIGQKRKQFHAALLYPVSSATGRSCVSLKRQVKEQGLSIDYVRGAA